MTPLKCYSNYQRRVRRLLKSGGTFFPINQPKRPRKIKKALQRARAEYSEHISARFKMLAADLSGPVFHAWEKRRAQLQQRVKQILNPPV